MTHQSLVKLEDWIKIQVQLKYRFFFIIFRKIGIYNKIFIESFGKVIYF